MLNLALPGVLISPLVLVEAVVPVDRAVLEGGLKTRNLLILAQNHQINAIRAIYHTHNAWY